MYKVVNLFLPFATFFCDTDSKLTFYFTEIQTNKRELCMLLEIRFLVDTWAVDNAIRMTE